METQKIINLLNNSENEYSRFATKKWNIIDSESKGNYSHENPIKFLTKSIESSLCDYSDAYILVTGNITVTGGNNNTKVAFKNCAPFNKCRTEINETFVDEADIIDITMPMYNLLEYSDNYSDTSGSLWNFNRDEIEEGDDYTTGCLLDFAYFEKDYKTIAADLSKQKVLDADSKAIQQIIFTRPTNAQIRVYYILG